jgi:uncharacterized protein YgiM (DUF1202 family)
MQINRILTAVRGPNSIPRRFQRRLTARQRGMVALLALSLLWLMPILACGSFQERPTPTPPPAVERQPVADTPAFAPVPTDTPSIVVEPTPTFTPEPTPTDTPTPMPGTVLVVGEPARVVAGGGLNLRETPSTDSTLVTRLGAGQRVTVTEGPVAADGYVWWRVDDGRGTVGWAAQGDDSGEWLAPATGQEPAQAVNRAPRVGDRVRITMEGGQLSVRSMPGTNAPIVTRASTGDEFTVLAGPQSANGFIWYQIRSDDGRFQGWAADGNQSTRWLSPLE